MQVRREYSSYIVSVGKEHLHRLDNITSRRLCETIKTAVSASDEISANPSSKKKADDIKSRNVTGRAEWNRRKPLAYPTPLRHRSSNKFPSFSLLNRPEAAFKARSLPKHVLPFLVPPLHSSPSNHAQTPSQSRAKRDQDPPPTIHHLLQYTHTTRQTPNTASSPVQHNAHLARRPSNHMLHPRRASHRLHALHRSFRSAKKSTY